MLSAFRRNRDGRVQGPFLLLDALTDHQHQHQLDHARRGPDLLGIVFPDRESGIGENAHRAAAFRRKLFVQTGVDSRRQCARNQDKEQASLHDSEYPPLLPRRFVRYSTGASPVVFMLMARGPEFSATPLAAGNAASNFGQGIQNVLNAEGFGQDGVCLMPWRVAFGQPRDRAEGGAGFVHPMREAGGLFGRQAIHIEQERSGARISSFGPGLVRIIEIRSGDLPVGQGDASIRAGLRRG